MDSVVNQNGLAVNSTAESATSQQVSENVVKAVKTADGQNDDNTNITKRKRKTSKVWSEFSVIDLKDGGKKIQCDHCKTRLAFQSSGSTSHLNRHMLTCTVRLSKMSGKDQKVLNYPSITPEGKLNSLTSFKYDKEKIRDLLATMVIVHEYPFRMVEHKVFTLLLKSLNPRYEPISRMTVKADCMRIYSLEKKKLKIFLEGINRISLTSDLWTSNQTIGYMSLTAHYLDSEWKLHKKVLNFCHMPPPHSGLMISDTILACLNDWGIDNKISTITLDNASSNDSAIRHLKDSFTLKGNLYFGGKIFHVRCCAHVLNIMVQDGLNVINYFIANVRDSIKYLKGSPARLHRFYEIARNLKLSDTKKLVLDVPTRWNSTYAMLQSAIKYKEVFPRYQERDPYFHYLPSSDEWERETKIMQFLEVFSEATNVFSGYEYPTSNLFLPEIWKIKETLLVTCNDESDFMRVMALKMKEKFEKYWGECNLLMAIASVLDPRYKMKLVEFCFPKIYSSRYEADLKIEYVHNELHELYKYYAANHNILHQNSVSSPNVGSTSSGSFVIGKNVSKSQVEFDDWAKDTDNMPSLKSDLDVYLEEGRYICNVGENFDALQWWKANALKFRVLSHMAKDILSIPVSTVASESTFSAGGRVLDQYRSSLKPETVQGLVCTSDWLKGDFTMSSNENYVFDEEGDAEFQVLD